MSDATVQVTQPPDLASTRALHDAVLAAHGHLEAVLVDRAEALASLDHWWGPHRDRYEEDARALLRAGRAVASSLRRAEQLLDADLSELRRAAHVPGVHP